MKLQTENGILTLRVAGVFKNAGRVLLHRMERDNFFALPGGGVEFGEDAATALQREVKEELGAEIRTGKVICVIENFFEHNGYPWHEIGFYIEAEFIGDSIHFYNVKNFQGIEDKTNSLNPSTLVFEWIMEESLDKIDLRPFMAKDLLRQTSSFPQFLVNRG